MFGFKDFLILEGFENIYKSCKRDILIEQACLNALKVILESAEEDEDGEFTGNLEDEKFPEPDEKVEPIKGSVAAPSSEPSAEELEKQSQSTMRKLQKDLRDAILVLRWNAMKGRSEDIQKVRALRDQYIENYGNPYPSKVSESTEDPEELAAARFSQAKTRVKSKFDVMSAAPLLEKLGYLKLEDLYDEGLDEEEVKKAVTAALFKAAEEDENDPPPKVDLSPANVQEQKEIFFDSIKEIFRNQFRGIVRRQSAKVATKDGGMTTAYQLFDPGERVNPRDPGNVPVDMIDDIANAFSLELYETFTSREVSKGTAEPWLRLKVNKKDIGFGDTKEEIDDERTVEPLINYIRSTLKHFYSNQQRKQKMANSPSAPTEDLEVWGGNRDKKANLINSDIEKDNLDAYKRYITTDSEQLENRLNALRAKLKETKKLSAAEHEEKWRLEIVTQILFLHSKHSRSLSLDPQNIVSTLQFYRSNFLGKKYRVQSFFGAMGRKTDDGEASGVDLGFGTDSTARAGDAGGNRDRGQSSFPNPAAETASQEMKRTLHQKLIAALNQLRGERSGKEHALAICVFWELGDCSLDSSPTNIDNFSNLIIHVSDQEEKELKKIRQKRASGQQLTPAEMEKETKLASCEYILFNHLRSAGDGRKGKSIQQANQEMNAILGYEVPENTFRNWLNNGVKYICNYMKGQTSSLAAFAPSIPSPSTASTTQSRRYDASRVSPLSRLRVPKVVANSETGEKSYETN